MLAFTLIVGFTGAAIAALLAWAVWPGDGGDYPPDDDHNAWGV